MIPTNTAGFTYNKYLVKVSATHEELAPLPFHYKVSHVCSISIYIVGLGEVKKTSSRK